MGGAGAARGPLSLSPAERSRWTRVGMLAALALLLGYLETFVPIPLPGIRLGLANVAVLVALVADGPACGAGVAAVKVLAGALLFGSPVTLAYSAAGTALSLVAMAPLARLPTMRVTMTSIVGAVAHETGQLLVASVLLGTPYVWLAAPALLVAATLTGGLCGAVATATLSAIATPDPAADAWAARLWKASAGNGDHDASDLRTTMRPVTRPRDARMTIALLVAYAIVLFHATGAALACALAAALVACRVAHVPPRRAARALRPTVAVALVATVAQLVGMQGGNVVMRVGPVAVHDVALAAAATSVARLVGVTAASLTFMQLTSAGDITAALTLARGPRAVRGPRIVGLGLALDTALRLAPALVDAAETGGLLGDEGDEGQKGKGVVHAMRTAPRLAAALYRTAGAAGIDTTGEGRRA